MKFNSPSQEEWIKTPEHETHSSQINAAYLCLVGISSFLALLWHNIKTEVWLHKTALKLH
jgi:hypothetical protein